MISREQVIFGLFRSIQSHRKSVSEFIDISATECISLDRSAFVSFAITGITPAEYNVVIMEKSAIFDGYNFDASLRVGYPKNDAVVDRVESALRKIYFREMGPL